MQNLRTILITVAGSALVISALYLVNDINISIRLMELKLYLQDIDYNESKNDHAELVSKFLMHKKMHEDKITREEVDSIEFQMNLVKLYKKSYSKVQMIEYHFLSIPAIWIINLNRRFIGKQAIQDFQPGSELSVDLDLAYYLERNEYYPNAAKKYEIVLSGQIRDPSLAAGVLLHYGFCYAMLGNFAKAKEILNLIIDKYSYDDSSVTASLLLWYIEHFSSLKIEILKTPDSAEKWQKLYNILAYREALNTIEKLEVTTANQSPKLNYYKALCLNEMGEKEKAVKVYLDLIKKNSDSYYAKLSNRRIYMIGSMIGGENKIKEISITMNEYYNDDKLSEMIDLEKIRTQKGTAAGNENRKIIPIEKIEEIIKHHKEEFSYLGKNVNVYTYDGDNFIGEVLAVTEEHYTLSTIIGKIDVKREKIEKIVLK